jgi:hypothetical protein
MPLLIITLILLFFGKTNLIFGQDCEKTPIPRMWELSGIGENRVKEFLKKKYPLLCDAIGKSDLPSIFYKRSDFENMINFFKGKGAAYLRIYLASYEEEGTEKVPVGYGRLMTLIFAPVSDNEKDMGTYFTISPYEPFDSVNSEISKTIKEKWIEYYTKNKLLKLNGTIDDHKDNEYKGKKSDTRRLLYPMDNILQLLGEMICQKASGIEAFFASYTDKGREGDAHFKKRLLVQWELTELIGSRHYVFNIEDRRDWRNRKPTTDSTEKLKRINWKILDFNHGALCPNYCPTE